MRPAPSNLTAEPAPAPSDSELVRTILEALERISAGQVVLGEAVAMLNQLDDVRSRDISDLRKTVALLVDEAGWTTSPSGLVDLIRDYTGPAPESLRVDDPRG